MLTGRPTLRIEYPEHFPSAELRALVNDVSITIERRWIRPAMEGGMNWAPVPCGAIVGYICGGEPVARWLEGIGVPYGAWHRKPSRTMASFRRSKGAR